MKTVCCSIMILGLLLAFQTGCAEVLNLPSATEAFPDTSTWILVRIGGTKAKQHTGTKVFITVDKKEQKVSGYTSCNYIRTLISLKDSTIKFSDITLGKRVCDDATAELEKTLQDSLQKCTHWKIEENILYLFDKGFLILEFKNPTSK